MSGGTFVLYNEHENILTACKVAATSGMYMLKGLKLWSNRYDAQTTAT